MTEDRSPYVTYKWLIGTVIASLLLMTSVIGILFSVLSTSLNSKVSMELYASQHTTLCTDIDEIKRVVDANAKALDMFGRNQLLVLRQLKIEAVK